MDKLNRGLNIGSSINWGAVANAALTQASITLAQGVLAGFQTSRAQQSMEPQGLQEEMPTSAFDPSALVSDSSPNPEGQTAFVISINAVTGDAKQAKSAQKRLAKALRESGIGGQPYMKRVSLKSANQ